jgi:transposase
VAGLKIMMGHRQVEQAALFYEFSLEKHIPADHLLRSIDRFIDLQEIRRDLAPFYSNIGRPSIDPELMIRMLLIGYCFGIRSEQRLCDEVHLNLAYRWFCRLGLDGTVPDHSTFSKNRHGRFRESDLFRRVFESVLRRCIEEHLVAVEGLPSMRASTNIEPPAETCRTSPSLASNFTIPSSHTVSTLPGGVCQPICPCRPERARSGYVTPDSGTKARTARRLGKAVCRLLGYGHHPK